MSEAGGWGWLGAGCIAVGAFVLGTYVPRPGAPPEHAPRPEPVASAVARRGQEPGAGSGGADLDLAGVPVVAGGSADAGAGGESAGDTAAGRDYRLLSGAVGQLPEAPGEYAAVGAPMRQAPGPEAPDLAVTDPGGAAAPTRAEEPVTVARERPVSAWSAEAAAAEPLLAVPRGGGRLSFIQMVAGTAGRRPEGEWARAGRCGDRVELVTGFPAAAVGTARGVGRGVGEEGRPFVTFAAQGCRRGSGAWTGARELSRAEREWAGAGGREGAGDGRGVDALGGGIWRVAGGSAAPRVVLLGRGAAGWEVAWEGGVPAGGDGPRLSRVTLLGVHRSGRGERVWAVATRTDGAVVLLAVVKTGAGAVPRLETAAPVW